MTNWTLQYSGGSGGFLLLHLLLLSDRFYTAFHEDLPLDQIIQKHWNIPKPDQWKLNEIWPHNQLTQASTVDSDKIYFCCNPYYDDCESDDLPCKNIVIYTDYHSQQLLAHYKKANWYYGRTSNVWDLRYMVLRTFLKSWQQHYANVKDPSWPKCLSVRHINRLPERIQKELLADPNIEYFLNFKYEQPSAYFNNELVHKPMVPYLESANVIVKLQDLVNSNGKILETLFDIPKINSKQQQLLKKWKQYHTPELLSSIGITI